MTSRIGRRSLLCQILVLVLIIGTCTSDEESSKKETNENPDQNQNPSGNPKPNIARKTMSLVRNTLFQNPLSRVKKVVLAVENLRQQGPLKLLFQGNPHKCLQEIENIPDNIGKYQKLRDMQNENQDSFYACLIRHVEKLLPIVYTPVVGDVCQNYGKIKGDRGLMLKITEESEMKNKLEDWKKKHPTVKAIVVTDGGRILGLGDLGANGMGIPIGKMIIYSALGGVDPEFCLPVTLDVGTTNQELRKSGLYVGLDQDRVTGEQYDNFVDKFVNTAVEVFGKNTLIQFEDFVQENAFKFLRKYQKVHTVFNDDIQGTAAVALAGILAAERVSSLSLKESKVLFAGAGGAGVGIAELLVKYMSEQGLTEEEARKRIFFKRSKKLIMEGEEFPDDDLRKLYTKAFGKEVPEGADIENLLEIIKWLKPNILIGVSSQHGLFDENILSEMAKHSDSPIIFALSNPLTKAECTAEDAYKHTEGRALFASGSPFDPVKVNGVTRIPRQCNNAYIFPGLALAITAAEMTEVPEDVFLIAAKVVSKQCTKAEDVNQGSLFPSLDRLRDCSILIATEVAEYAFKEGKSALKEKPEDLRKFMIQNQYTPSGTSKTKLA